MANPLKIAEPPRRRGSAEQEPWKADAVTSPKVEAAGAKFRQIKEDEMVQFNKRVPRHVADGFELLAIRTRKKVPALLGEALELLEQQYGKV